MLAKALEIEVGDKLPSTYLDPRYGRLDLLVLSGNRPLAILAVFPQHGKRVIEHSQIKESMEWQAWTLSCAKTGAPASSVQLPAISVVVCTKDRPFSLDICLQSLRALDYPNYEVVVVDNRSSTSEVRDTIVRNGFRYVREEMVGVDWARNRGIKEARHDIVAYIDDDAIASRGWLRGIAEGFEDSGVSVVTGLVLPAELETEAQVLFEWYGGMSKGFVPRLVRPELLAVRDIIGVHQYGLGANMAYRRSAFSKVGTFDTALDVGTPSGGAGDLDMLHRVLAGGLTISYQPAAWVRHRHRRDRDGLRRQIHANGRAFGVYLMKVWRQRSAPRLSVTNYATTWLSGWVLRRIFRRVFRRDTFPLDLSWAEFRGALTAPLAFFQTYRHDRVVRAKSLQDSD